LKYWGRKVEEEHFSEIEIAESLRVEDASLSQKLVDKKNRPWIVPLLLGTGFGVAIAFLGMRFVGSRPATQQNAIASSSTRTTAVAMTVTVAPAETTRVSRTIIATGTIAARELIPVLPQSNGLQIRKIPDDIQEGVFVKKGQVLAILDDAILQTQINQAKADVESKQAELASRQSEFASKQAVLESTRAAVASNEAAVQERQADLAQSRAKLTDAERTFRRNQELVAAGAISRQQLDTSETNLSAAREAVRLVEANIRSAQANVVSAQASVSSAQANVGSAEAGISSGQAIISSNAARVEQLKTQLGQTIVRAPVSGIIGEKSARLGDITGIPPQTQTGTVVGGTQKLFSIIRDGKLELQAQVPETQLSQVKQGASVQITSDVNSRLQLQGRVREIQPLINQQRREVIVKIDLPTTTSLKPGMFARAAITTTTIVAVAVPQKAVLPQPDGSAIVFMLMGEDIVRAQKVQLGEILSDNKVEIKSGLDVGQNTPVRLVLDGAGYLKDGDKVRVVGTGG
jgi:HlyD family secretion protein